MENGRNEAGQDRVFIAGLGELNAVKNIVGAFATFAETELHLTPDTLEAVRNTEEVISDSQSVITNARTETRVNADNQFSFGDPFMTMIRYAVAVFEQYPQRLESYFTAGDLMEARVFFPPNTPEEGAADKLTNS